MQAPVYMQHMGAPPAEAPAPDAANGEPGKPDKLGKRAAAERRKLNNRLSARRSYQRKRDRSQRLEQENKELRDALHQVQTLQAVRHRLDHPEAPHTALAPALPGQPGALGNSVGAAPRQAERVRRGSPAPSCGRSSTE